MGGRRLPENQVSYELGLTDEAPAQGDRPKERYNGYKSRQYPLFSRYSNIVFASATRDAE